MCKCFICGKELDTLDSQNPAHPECWEHEMDDYVWEEDITEDRDQERLIWELEQQ